MPVLYGHSTNPNATAAIEDIKRQVESADARLLIFFAAPSYDAQELAAAVGRAFPTLPSLGCSTAGEIVSGRMLKSSIVAMTLGADVVSKASVAVARSIGTDARGGVRQALEQMSSQLDLKIVDRTSDDVLGLVLVDGLSCAEEGVMDALGDATGIPFVGGSAGDDLAFKRTWVFANGEAHSDAAVLATLVPTSRFEIVKVQSFEASSKVLKVTEADVPNRTILKLDHQPAAQAYAQAVGVDPSNAANHFSDHPVGLMVENEPWVRSPQRLDGDNIVFYCQVLEGMELRLLNATDIVRDMSATLSEIRGRGTPKAIINFHCILRTLELEQKKQTGAYGELFADIPTVGFSTYGEQYIGHINQTSTLAVFR